MKKSELKKLIREIIEIVAEGAKEETLALLKSYNGKSIPDDKIHAIADKYNMSPHELESYIYSLASAHVSEDSILGGKGDKTDPSSVDANELAVGKKVEREHTDSDERAEEIALDHLTENPKYYSELVASGIVDEKDALELAKKLNIGQIPIKESAVGDMYIKIGEAIEEMETQQLFLEKNLHKFVPKNPKIRSILSDIHHGITKLKNELGENSDSDNMMGLGYSNTQREKMK